MDKDKGRHDTSKTANKNRKRAFAPKVTTGCQTCKLRRVKCGEEKPICKRCSVLGRACVYRFGDAVVPAPNLNNCQPRTSVGTVEEIRSLYYFQTQCVNRSFLAEFWSRAVLPVSYSESAVKHALLAMSAFQESLDFRQRKEFDSAVQLDKFGFQQYTKAIGILANFIATKKDQSLQVTLMSCFIFVLLEILAENYKKATHHLKCGLQILQDWRRRKHASGLNSNFDIPLVVFFRRVVMNILLQGGICSEIAHQYFIAEAFDARYSQANYRELNEASGRAGDHLTVAHRFHLRYDDELGAALHQIHIQCQPNHTGPVEDPLRRLHLWYRDVIEYMDRWKVEVSSIWIMHQQAYFCIILLLSSVNKESEMWFDDHDYEFEQILKLSEAFLTCHRSQGPGVANFALNTGVIRPLFYVAVRCRRLDYRQRALYLMLIIGRNDPHVPYLHMFAEWRMKEEELLRGPIPPSEPLPLHARISREGVQEVMLESGEKMLLFTYEQGLPLPNGERIIKRTLLPDKYGHSFISLAQESPVCQLWNPVWKPEIYQRLVMRDSQNRALSV